MDESARLSCQAPTLEVAAAVNRLDVLEQCLGRSPDIVSGAFKLRTYQDFACAGQAYNRALAESEADVLVFAHQDVYLPAGFREQLLEQLSMLSAMDPAWAVAGVIGLDQNGSVQGETWSSGLGRMVGARITSPQAVVTLDEVLLVVRRAAAVRFDPDMPGFHLYGADIVQTALSKGLSAYAVPLALVHHSKPVIRLDRGYRGAYRHMQRKWRNRLPIPNLVCPIRRSGLELLVRDVRLRWRNRRHKSRAAPTESPQSVAARLGYEASPSAGPIGRPAGDHHDLAHQ